MAQPSTRQELIDYCKRKLGAPVLEINGIEYMNDGDWVESCTALVENHDGSWEIVNYLHNINKSNKIEKFS